MPDLTQLERLPVSYQALDEFFAGIQNVQPYALREETFRRIERLTQRPLLCYVAKTNNVSPGIPAYIDNGDLTAMSDLARSVEADAVDVFLSSNGGSPEAAERIVRLLRDRFKKVRFIVAGNAYSAATLICFSGDEIIMDGISTLGPVDPQINGIPARAILRAFETLEARLKEEGPRALTAYMPLISKYDLHLLEICRSAQQLSRELATEWLRTYMLKENHDRVPSIVDFFLNYDVHKSHGRSIGRERARELGLSVADLEQLGGDLTDVVRSLHNQYELWFEKTPFYKVFENAHGIHWGRQAQQLTFQLPLMIPPGGPMPVPQPGPPQRST